MCCQKLNAGSFKHIGLATAAVFFYLNGSAQQETAQHLPTFWPDSSQIDIAFAKEEPIILPAFTSIHRSENLLRNFVATTASAAPNAFARLPKAKPSTVVWKVAIGSGYVALTYWCYKQADKDLREDSQEDLDGLPLIIARRASPLGEGKYHAMAFAATGVASLLLKDKKLQHTMLVWAGAGLLNDFATNNLKNKFQRHRPNTGKPPNTFDWANGSGVNRSFPSAHTSNAFTAATVFATTYKDKRWVPPVAYGLATIVGASRIYNNAHWTSDVMAGAAVGFLSAKLSIFLNERITRAVKKNNLNKNLSR